MKEINDSMLESVIGGAYVRMPDFAGADASKSESCGRYFARDGREREKPDCRFCIHSSRNARGEYVCALDD